MPLLRLQIPKNQRVLIKLSMERMQSSGKKVIDREHESLFNNNTLGLVELPEGKSVVGCKWVFKIKRNADGTVSSYKARLVAQGF